MVPNSGNGRSSCDCAIVAPLKLVPGIRLRNGLLLLGVAIRKLFLAVISASRKRLVERYCLGMALRIFVLTIRSEPRVPTYCASTSQPPGSSRCTPNDQRCACGL